MLENSLYTLTSFEKTESSITASLTLDPSSAVFTGHFPEKPVLPGVCLTHIVTELLSKGLENEYKLEEGKQLKFLSLVTPDTTTDLFYEISYKEMDEKISLSADVKAGETVCFKLKATYSLL